MDATVEVEHLFLRMFLGFYRLSKLLRLMRTTSSQDSAFSYASSASLNAPYDSFAFPYLIWMDLAVTLSMMGAACLNIFSCR